MAGKYEMDFCESFTIHKDKISLVEDRMPPEDEMADMAELFKVFGDSTRIKILYILSETELCVCDMAQLLGLSQPAVSYQLKVLKQAKLVKNRREGKTVFYFLADEHVETIIGMAKEHLEEQ